MKTKDERVLGQVIDKTSVQKSDNVRIELYNYKLGLLVEFADEDSILETDMVYSFGELLTAIESAGRASVSFHLVTDPYTKEQRTELVISFKASWRILRIPIVVPSNIIKLVALYEEATTLATRISYIASGYILPEQISTANIKHRLDMLINTATDMYDNIQSLTKLSWNNLRVKFNKVSDCFLAGAYTDCIGEFVYDHTRINTCFPAGLISLLESYNYYARQILKETEIYIK